MTDEERDGYVAQLRASEPTYSEGSLERVVVPQPDQCCLEWSRSGKEIDNLLILAWSHGMEYQGAPFMYCPWCGRVRHNDKLTDRPANNQ